MVFLGSGDRLVDLTSRDGGWFLDEMHLLYSSCVEISNLFSLSKNVSSSSQVMEALTALQALHDVFTDLMVSSHLVSSF